MKSSDFDTIIEAFEKIERTRGRNEKLSVLASLASKPETNSLTREILTYLLNPYWTYGVRLDSSEYSFSPKSPVIVFDDDSDKYWPAFRDLLDSLRVRVISGNAAREAIQVVLDSMSVRYAWFLCNLLNRDLRCGVQWGSFAKSFPDLVPVIAPQLCNKMDMNSELPPGQYHCEPKFDGARLHILAHEDGTRLALSRNGLPSHNCDHIFEAIDSMPEVYLAGNYGDASAPIGYVIDSEEYAGSWSKTVTLKTTTSKVVEKKIIHCFDMIPISDWERKECTIPLKSRRRSLEHWYEKLEEANPGIRKYIKLVPNPIVKDKKGVLVWTRKYRAKGLEGSVVKNVEGMYKFDRTDDWLKVKPLDTHTFTIVGYKKGTKGKQHENHCGAIQIKGKFEGVKILSWMGQGMKNHERIEITKRYRKKVLLGSKIDVEFQGSTDKILGKVNPDGTHAVRNGVFKGWRVDLE